MITFLNSRIFTKALLLVNLQSRGQKMSVDILIDPATNDIAHRNGLIRYAVSGNETAQRVITRIRRLKGEWFIDTTAGMPYIQDILGKRDINYFKLLLRKEILNTDGVQSINNFRLSFNSKTGHISVYVEIKVDGKYIPIVQEFTL